MKCAISIACIVLGISATVEGATVTLEWNSNPEPDIEGYRLSYGTVSGQYTTTIDVGDTTRFTVSNLLDGRTYYFALRAYNSAGTSPYSNEVSATLGSPLSVTNLTANKASPQLAGSTITFSAVASGGTAPYQYKWWIISGTTQTVGRNWSTSNTFAWTPASANPGYVVRVWARNASSTADAPDSSAATLQMSFAITSSGPTNQAPVVNAGANQNITLPGSAALSATVSDDGLPSGSLTRTWTKVSGPGTVTFSAPASATTSASFSTAGTYVLRLTASDGALSTSDDVTVTVAAAGTSPGGLIAHWRLDQTSGTSATDSAGSHTGTLMNGAAWTTGKSAGGVRFDGTNDFIALPSLDVPGSAITIAAWINTSSLENFTDQRFVSKANGSDVTDHYWMLGQTIVNGQSRLRFRLKTNGATTTLVASSGNLPLNTWVHATATYDGTRMRLYLNGVAVGSITKTGAIDTNAGVPANIGRNPNGSSYMDGVIDDVRVYNRALTATEITQMMGGSSSNQAPVVNAGANQNVTLPGSAALSATVSDDGLPSGSLTRTWTKASGPGTVTFSAPTSATTSASFSTAGTYVARLTVSDGALSASDDVTVTVAASGTAPGGLIAHWRLNQTSGTSATDSAGSHTGTLMNGAAWTTGKSGGGVRFDGVNDFIVLPGLDVPGSAITIAAWINTSSLENFTDQRFVSKANGSDVTDHYWMLGQTVVNGQSRLRFRLKTNGVTTTLLASSGNLPLNTWVHATATYDGSAMRLYLNGVAVGSIAKTGALTTSPTVPANIGRNPSGSNYMKGVIDDVRIYNRALTAAEIGSVMSNP